MINFTKSACLTLILTLVTLFLLYRTLELNSVARRVPLIVVIVTLGLLVFQLALDLIPRLTQKYSRFEKVDVFQVDRVRERTHDGRTRSRATLSKKPEELKVLGWVLMLIMFVMLAGFMIAVPLYTFLYLKWRAGESWRLAVMMTTGIWAFLYGVFVIGLHVWLYEGYLWNWLGL